MKIRISAKRQIIRGLLVLALFVLGIAACSNFSSKTPVAIAPTQPHETDSYRFQLEKTLGRGIVEAVDWAPDGNSFALATSLEVDVYDAGTLELAQSLDTGQWSKSIAYSPDSRILAAAAADGTVQVWDLASQKQIHRLTPDGIHPTYANPPVLIFSRDGQFLISSLYQTLYIWDLTTGALRDSFPGHVDGIQSIALSPDGNYLIAAGRRQIYVRSISTRDLLYSPIELQDEIVGLFFEQGGTRFGTVNSQILFETDVRNESKVRSWDLLTGKMLDEHLATRSNTRITDINSAQNQIVLGEEHGITIWDASANKVVFSLQGQTPWLKSITVNPQGNKLLLVSPIFTNDYVQLWDLTSRQQVKNFDEYSLAPDKVAFSPDEKRIAIASTHGVIQVRDVRDGKLLYSLNGGAPLAFSPDSQIIAFTTLETNNHVVLANAETGTFLPDASFPCSSVTAIAFHPNGSAIAFGGGKCDLQLHDIQTGKLVSNLSQVEGNGNLRFDQLSFSPDGKKLFLGGYEPKILDVQTGKTIKTLGTGNALSTAHTLPSPDGRYLALGGVGEYYGNKGVEIWDITSGQKAFTLDTLQMDIYNMVFSRDGRLLVTAGQGMELWDLWNGRPLAKLETSEDALADITFSTDGRTLITLGKDGSIRRWRIEPDPQTTLRSLPTPTTMPTLAVAPTITAVELTSVAELGRGYSSILYHSADGRLLAFVEEDQLKWFDAVSHRQLGAVKVGKSFGEVVFSPNNKFAIVNSYEGTKVIYLEKQSIVGQVPGGTGVDFGFTFTQDSHFMAYTNGSSSTGGPYYSIGLWDLVKQKKAFANYDHFRTLLEDRYHTMSAPAISPDGNLVAAGHSDKRVYVWDLHTGKSVWTLEGHAEEVTAVDFSPNGKVLASGSQDGTIRLWDPSTGKPIKVLTGFTDDIQDIHFTPDGRDLKVSVVDQPEQLIALDTGKIKPVSTPAITVDPLEMQQYREGFSKRAGSMYSQVLFSPDGNKLALVNQSVLLWDVTTKKLITFLDNSTGDVIRGVAFNSRDTLLAAATDDDRVLVWDVKTGKQIFHQKSTFLPGTTVFTALEDSEPGLARGWDSLAEQGLAFSPDSDRLAFGNGNAIEIWDVSKSEKVARFANPEGSYPTQFSFSEDGKRLYVILNRNRRAQVWDVTSGKLISQVELTHVDPNAYTAVALHGPLFARNNADDQGNSWIELWNLNEEKIIKIDVPFAQNEPLRFSPDGSLLAATVAGADSSSVYFWKTTTGELIYQANFDANRLAISSDNRWLAVGMDGKAKIYDLQPVAALSRQTREERPVASATPTPVSFAWPTTTPAPSPTPSAEKSASQVIDAENAPQVVEKARFGNGTIEHLTWSPTGDAIVTCGSLGISQYSLHEATKALSERLQVEISGWTYQTIYLPDGRLLAASVDSGRVRVRDISTGKILAEVKGSEPAISPDGSLLAYLDLDGFLQTRDLVKEQSAIHLRSDHASPHWPVFSPDGKWIAAIQSTGWYDDSVRVWNARTGEVVNALAGPDNDITDLSFSDDGQFLVGAAGGSAWIWDARPGSTPEKIQLYEVEINGNLNLYTHTVTAAALSPDEQVVAIGTSEGDLRIYDRQTQQLSFHWKEYSSPIQHLRFSPDGKMLASVDEDGEIIVWDMTSHQRLASANDHKGPIAGLVYRADGDLAAWGTGAAWQIKAPEGTLQQSVHIASGRILAVSPAGDLLAAYDPFQVSLWDARNGKFLQRLEGEAQVPILHYRYEGLAFRQFYSAVFSQDGRHLATAGSGGVWYYETASRKLLQQLPGSNAQKIAMSPDGNWLLTSLSEQDDPVAVYDAQDGSLVFPLDEYGWRRTYLRSAFSPDGRWVGTVKNAFGESPALVIYEAVSHQIYRSIPLEKDISLTSLAFSPSENIIAAGTADGKILLIDFSTLEILATLSGHHTAVDHLIFSPDGQYLISASADGTVRTWGLP